MRFKQQVLLKHAKGNKAQWMSDDYSWLAVATFEQNETKGTTVDGTEVIIKKWAMVNCSGPWTGLSPDGKDLVIVPGFEKEHEKIASEASLILTCVNATIGGEKALNSIWSANKIGFDGSVFSGINQ